MRIVVRVDSVTDADVSQMCHRCVTEVIRNLTAEIHIYIHFLILLVTLVTLLLGKTRV